MYASVLLELIGIAELLLIAGHETTSTHRQRDVHPAPPSRPARVAARRAGAVSPATIEELLRFDGPVQVATFRWTTVPVQIGDTVIPAGEVVIPGLLAANRDAAAVADPDVFDPTREATPWGTSPSATACTTAWGRPWPGWSCGSHFQALLAGYPGWGSGSRSREVGFRAFHFIYGLRSLPGDLVRERP